MTQIKTKHEHGIETYIGFFRGVLVDEYETAAECQAALDALVASFKAAARN